MKSSASASPKICMFFTYGVGLQNWASSGMLARELAIYKALVAKDIQVAFWTYDDEIPDELRRAIAPIEVFPVGSLGSGRVFPFLRSLVLPLVHRRWLKQFDLFKTNQLWGAWPAWVASMVTGRPWILREGYEYYQFAIKMGKARWKRLGIFVLSWLLYKGADAVVVTSRDIKDFVISIFGISAGKIQVLSNYVESDRFRPNGEGISVIDRFLFVGRLSEQKNLEMVISAVSEAGVGLDIVGEGPLREKLERQAQATGADVHFLGAVPNERLPGIYSGYLACLLFSHFEGVPKTLLEAMACESLVICSDVEGIREFVENGKTGILLPKQLEPLVSTLRAVKARPREFSQLKKAARVYIEKEHSLRELSVKEAELYEGLISEKNY